MVYKYQEQQTIWESNEPTDGVLVGQAVAGDEQALEVLVRRYQSALLHYIQKILKDEEQANDVLQAVLLQFYLSLPTLLRDVSLRPWLFQVARNRCLDELRRRRTRPALRFSELSGDDEQVLTEAIQDTHPLPEEIIEQGEMRAALQQAIGKLPPTLRSIVDLRFFEELTFTEIAHTLKLPTSTTKTYCYRSMERLRSVLASNPLLAVN